MSAPNTQPITRRVVGSNVWLAHGEGPDPVAALQARELRYEILESEEAVGRAQLEELQRAAREKDGDVVIILLGGRGAQAMYRILGALAEGTEADALLARLHVFTQDALAPMRMDNGLSFVRDFERLLGASFFSKVKSFTPMRTDTSDLEGGLARYLERLESLGGIDIFFLGLGPEPGEASHLCYIKPGSGATARDVAGVIPISQSILEHHITKFKVGGSRVTAEDEAECRAATHILTLGPAAILGARRIVQSIVDASTAPAKRASYRRVLETKIEDDVARRAAQMDKNPGLWLRLHPNVRSLVLPDVFQAQD
ncbi:MAG TPA: 6-phosphogluconolactonase [Pyrinomonadaceae bacterium]|nr:6-phosphogluconolactonase [Pyrinomonadaceae bacterium]